jgi:hypothetical protein
MKISIEILDALLVASTTILLAAGLFNVLPSI